MQLLVVPFCVHSLHLWRENKVGMLSKSVSYERTLLFIRKDWGNLSGPVGSEIAGKTSTDVA